MLSCRCERFRFSEPRLLGGGGGLTVGGGRLIVYWCWRGVEVLIGAILRSSQRRYVILRGLTLIGDMFCLQLQHMQAAGICGRKRKFRFGLGSLVRYSFCGGSTVACCAAWGFLWMS